jgi:hypothetical protein
MNDANQGRHSHEIGDILDDIALDVRKPEATGLGNACKLVPDRQSYYLRDQVDYTLFPRPSEEGRGARPMRTNLLPLVLRIRLKTKADL